MSAPKTAKQPSDYKRKEQRNAARAEALDEPLTFEFDGDQFTMTPSDATRLDFLAALEDEQIIAACRILLGAEQASRLFAGRKVQDLEGFFDCIGEAIEAANP